MVTLAQNGQKTAFVTGASSGIGKAAALALAGAGYRVIGTSRKAAPGEVRAGIRMIACDVTDDASVAEAVALAQADAAAKGATLYVTLEPCAHESPMNLAQPPWD